MRFIQSAKDGSEKSKVTGVEAIDLTLGHNLMDINLVVEAKMLKDRELDTINHPSS